ncbi:hypothetical protein DSO57_1009095 [Entomophthora muscae]|uniref:Uncharacterized protein n=1 Tax=Entomophthora muscae TaxID=34485 RepID=A0ACC2S993_9FUNG|nr:hypothetical protein DSO57_1009095 [Entomophthora muscae]
MAGIPYESPAPPLPQPYNHSRAGMVILTILSLAKVVVPNLCAYCPLAAAKIIQIKQTAQASSLKGHKGLCHHPQACQEACKSKDSHSLPHLHLLSPFPPSFPCKSLPNKSDDYLNDHSFYQSEADSEPTKECCAKKGKAAKDPNSSSCKNKEAFKQASKNPCRVLRRGTDTQQGILTLGLDSY